MKKIIKKYGNSNIIKLTPEEMQIYQLETGDILNVLIEKQEQEKEQ